MKSTVSASHAFRHRSGTYLPKTLSTEPPPRMIGSTSYRHSYFSNIFVISPGGHTIHGVILRIHLLRGTLVNRTYGIHKNLYIFTSLPTIFGPINYGPP